MSHRTDTQMKFDFKLLDALPVKVANLANDSRKVQVGDTFLAYPGERGDEVRTGFPSRDWCPGPVGWTCVQVRATDASVCEGSERGIRGGGVSGLPVGIHDDEWGCVRGSVRLFGLGFEGIRSDAGPFFA